MNEFDRTSGISIARVHLIADPCISRPRGATRLREYQAQTAKLDAAIAANLKELGYGG